MSLALSNSVGIFLQALSNGGLPLSGGLLYSFAAGTSAPQATFADSIGTPNPNPIQLDASGRLPGASEIWITDGLAYRFELRDSLNNVLQSQDNVSNSLGVLAGLAAPGGSALVGFLQAGAGAVPTTDQARLRDTINVTDYGVIADWDGVAGTDQSGKLNQAHTTALALGKALYIPGSTLSYLIASTVNYKVPMIGDPCNGGNLGSITGTRFFNTIADGTAALQIDHRDYWYLENIWINGGLITQNCIGLNVINSSNRWQAKNVHVRACGTGVKIDGFIGDGDIFIDGCTTAFVGTLLNDVNLRLHIEQCMNGGSIGACSTLRLDLLLEGTAALVTGMLFDGVRGLRFTPYFEGDITSVNLQYFAKFGATTRCFQVKVLAGSTFTGVTPTDACWVFDQVTGLDVDKHYALVSQGVRLVRTTANTQRVDKLDFYTSNVADFVQDTSKSMRAYKNIVCNGNLAAGLKGFGSIIPINGAIISLETAIVRGNGRALRVKSAAGIVAGGVSGVHLNLANGSSIATQFRSKRLFIGAWVWVPNIAEYANQALISPAIALNDGPGATFSAGGFDVLGSWNFIWTERVLDAAATGVTLVADPAAFVAGAYVTTGNEFIVIADWFLIDSSESDVDPSLVAAGRAQESGMSGRVIGSNVIIPGTAAPTDVIQVWTPGDEVLNTAAAAGGFGGFRCTTGGSPGTWKTCNPISV